MSSTIILCATGLAIGLIAFYFWFTRANGGSYFFRLFEWTFNGLSPKQKEEVLEEMEKLRRKPKKK